MAQVPTSGVAYVSGNANGIKESIIAGGGSPSADDIQSLRDAASFDLFDPDFLDGATDLSGIESLKQFRGYPNALFDMVSLGFYVDSAISNGQILQVNVAFHKSSNDSLIGNFQYLLTGSSTNVPASVSWSLLLGQSGSNGLASIRYNSFNATLSVNLTLYIALKKIIDLHGVFYVKITANIGGVAKSIRSTPIFPGATAWANDLNNVNYFRDVFYDSTFPTGKEMNGLVYWGAAWPPKPELNFSRSWNSTLVTETFSEFY